MMVVIRRSYRLTIGKFLTVWALFLGVLLGKVTGVHAAESVVGSDAISKVFQGATQDSAHGVLASGSASCYGQGDYYGQVAYYGESPYYAEGYYESSYQTTFTKNATALTGFTVTGKASKANATFLIDHPLDPVN